MRHAISASVLALTQLALLAPSLALGNPFFQAGVEGSANANAFNLHCGIPGDVDEGYQTYPGDASKAFAQGRATGFNPCSSTGSSLSIASANLATGQLRVFAMTQLGAAPFFQ